MVTYKVRKPYNIEYLAIMNPHLEGNVYSNLVRILQSKGVRASIHNPDSRFLRPFVRGYNDQISAEVKFRRRNWFRRLLNRSDLETIVMKVRVKFPNRGRYEQNTADGILAALAAYSPSAAIFTPEEKIREPENVLPMRSGGRSTKKPRKNPGTVVNINREPYEN